MAWGFPAYAEELVDVPDAELDKILGTLLVFEGWGRLPHPDGECWYTLKPWSLISFGERVTVIRVAPGRLRVRSECRSSLQFLDFGKNGWNIRNVREFLAGVKTIGEVKSASVDAAPRKWARVWDRIVKDRQVVWNPEFKRFSPEQLRDLVGETADRCKTCEYFSFVERVSDLQRTVDVIIVETSDPNAADQVYQHLCREAEAVVDKPMEGVVTRLKSKQVVRDRPALGTPHYFEERIWTQYEEQARHQVLIVPCGRFVVRILYMGAQKESTEIDRDALLVRDGLTISDFAGG